MIVESPADAPSAGNEPAQAATPAVPRDQTPLAPAAPTVLPENAAKPVPAPPGRRAGIGPSPQDNAHDGLLPPIRSISAASGPGIVHP